MDEPTYYTKEATSEEEEYENNNKSRNELCDTYYAYEKQKKTNKFTSLNQPHTTNKYQHNLPPKASSWRNNQPSKPTKGRNSHKNGQPARCSICQSINHWATQYPDKNMHDVTYMVHEIILQTSDDLLSHALLSESLCSAVLGSSTSNTVCGRLWLMNT